ncbi:hypothetical protein JW848_04035 [Candidatus Bipolaricaulota bacterium]|nr:hypothetical protein [Candidatus Bipolaricaulota bacterium]
MTEHNNGERLARVPATGVERGLELVAQIALGIEMAWLYIRFGALRESVSWPTLAGLFSLVAASIVLYTLLSLARRLRISSLPYASRIREPFVEGYLQLVRSFIALLKAIVLVMIGMSEWMWIQVALGNSESFSWFFLPAGVLFIAGAFLLFSRALHRLN